MGVGDTAQMTNSGPHTHSYSVCLSVCLSADSVNGTYQQYKVEPMWTTTAVSSDVN